MPYTNEFMRIFEKDAPEADALSYRQYTNIVCNGIQGDDELRTALKLLDNASLCLRKAAAFGDMENTFLIPHAIKYLSKAVDHYQKAENNTQTHNKYILGTSSNGNNALDWALKNSGPIPAETVGEYAMTIAALLQADFSEVQLQNKFKDDKNQLYQFIKNFPLYKKMNADLKFDEAFHSPESLQQTLFACAKAQAVHYLTCHFFMLYHRKSLEAFVSTLKEGTQKINVVEIGCAIPYELPALLHFFTARGIKMQYQGLDIDSKAIAKTKLLYQGVALEGGHSIQFGVKAGQTLSQSKAYEEKVDLVIIRHPDINSGKTGPQFSEILAETVPKILKPNGGLLLSCYWENEAECIQTVWPGPLKPDIEKKLDFVLHPGGAMLPKGSSQKNSIDRPYAPDLYPMYYTAQQLKADNKLRERVKMK